MKIIVKTKSGFLPKYETKGSAGMDIRAYLQEEPHSAIVLNPMQRELIPTGLYVEIPKGCEIQLRARSGLAIKHGVTLVNGIGTIDSDYRGEIKIPLINLGKKPVMIEDGDRIAQMVVCPIIRPDIEVVDEVSQTERGATGFASSGIK